MNRRHPRRSPRWLTLALTASGAVLLVGAGPAHSRGSTTPLSAGNLRVVYPTNGIDPGADPAFLPAGDTTVVHAICANLFNYPDRSWGRSGLPLLPEVAAAHPQITNHGKRYTFSIRRHFLFSNGKRVTAKDVQFSINRALNLVGPPWTNIKGAAAVVNHHSTAAGGLVVHNNKLIVNLVRADGALPAKLASPDFCILPTGTRVDPNNPVKVPITAGPYYIARHVVGHLLVLKRNRHYSGARTPHLNTINITVVDDSDWGQGRVKEGSADVAYVDLNHPGVAVQLAKTYGNRLRTAPSLATDYIPLNTSRGPFRSLALRQAVNYATNRGAFLRPPGSEPGGARRSDQILPPGMPAYSAIVTYPIGKPNFRKANEILRRAGKRCGQVTLYMHGDDAVTKARAQVLQKDWGKIGCRVTARYFPGDQIWPLIGRRGEPFDAVGGVGWAADYIDPADFIDLLDGNTIAAANNGNYAYLNVPSLNTRIHRADRMRGSARVRAFRQLDALITTKYVPWVATGNSLFHWFISKRVRGFVSQPCPTGQGRTVVDLAALSVK